MRRLLTTSVDWMEARSGIRSFFKWIADEPLPPGVGWAFTLGSALAFLLALQTITGIFLALYYNAAPDHAYASVQYITQGVRFGRLVRGLHFYGASLIVIIALLHLLRVFFYGSYKPPRELNWVVGVLLLLLILALALTGYLLPWDQRAYWATAVTINMTRTTPVAGLLLARLLRGGPVLGALTLTRWYAVHVLVFPGLLVLFTVIHLYLMRRHGISGPVTPRAGEPRPFYPYQAVRDALASAGLFLVLMALASRWHPVDVGIADPTDATFVPRPEWYFMFLFQLLKYFPGRWELLGAIVLPTLAVTVLLALPFFDRRPERRPSRRPVASAAAVIAVGVLAALTYMGLRDSPPAAAAEGPKRWKPREIAGRLLYAQQNCAKCHTQSGVGPDLAASARTHDDDWLIGHMSDPEMITPGLRPSPTSLGKQDNEALIAYVKRLVTGGDNGSPGLPPDREAGAAVFALNRCIRCHKIDGDGRSVGPDLSHVGNKRDVDYLVRWITDPKAVKPDTEMPAFGNKLTDEELHHVAAFLAGLK